MILSFKKQFVQPILDGTKVHTIREDKGNRWTVGKKIHFATGVRTKNYEQFMEGECIGLQKIRIKNEGIYVSERRLNYIEAKQLAFRDGFDYLSEFLKFFDRPFDGIIIHWTDFLY